MKINKFTKLKNGMYKLEMDNKNQYSVHEDIILKYNLLINKELNQEFLNQLLLENNKYDTYNISIKYLEKKLRSQKELEIYLLKKQISKENIEYVISLLLKQGYLNDEKYASSLINDRLKMSMYGPYKIRKELLDNGIRENIIEEKIIIFNDSLQLERINKIIEKQLKVNRNKSGMVLKKKIESYLINLGYSNELIYEQLKNISFSNPDLYKKEYDKAFKLLSKKYSGSELEYKVKQKLYQKGFVQNEYEN